MSRCSVRDTEVYSRLASMGVPNKAAWDLTAKIRDQLHPVAAVAAAKLHARAVQLKGLGAAASAGQTILQAGGIVGTGGAGGAVKGATAGASVGSAIFPGLGTAIGAAVGAIVGGLVHFGTGAQRLATATQIINELKATPPPLSAGRQSTLAVITECYGSLVSTGLLFGYVKPSPADSPSDIQNEFNSMMKTIVGLLAVMNANPVGATVSYSGTGFNGIAFNISFVNPGTSNTAAVVPIVIQAMIAWLTQMGKTDIANVQKDFSNPLVQLVFGLMTDYAIGQNPAPVTANLSTQVATSTVVSAPPAVAAAANSIVANPAAPQPQVPASTATVSPTTGAASTAGTDTTAALLTQMIASQEATQQASQQQIAQLAAQVAAQGVQQTSAGPPLMSSITEWIIPLGIGAAVLVAVMIMKKH